MSGALLAEWSRLLVASLVQAGLRHAVVSPGSRSTPFTWALAQEPGLTCHSIIDERSAAFFALGLARASGVPALVLSTSGSAAANYFPAVVEAALARVPLLVLTADRPFELQDVEAAQTIDQVKLYGDYTRRFFELGVPDSTAGALAAVQRVAAQALAACQAPEPGPVHLNARARKPLEPSAPTNDAERALALRVNALLARGVTQVGSATREPSPQAVEGLARALANARRGVMVCGPAPLAAAGARAVLEQLSERLAMPLYAEATSQLRFGAATAQADALDWLLRSPKHREALRPDCVLRFGGTPTSSGFELLLAERASSELHVVAEHGYPDPSSLARTLTFGPLELVAARLAAALENHRPAREQLDFRQALFDANERAWRAIDAAVAAPNGLDEPAAVQIAVEALPADGLLVVGNSLPVREVDAYLRAGAKPLAVLGQRGANGIDGLIAGAAGAALAAQKPALLLLGDVSFAHDLGSLAAARLVRTPLALVIIDNLGGRIFEQLPVARLFEEEPARADLWLTPPALAVEHAGPLFGLPYFAPHDLGALRETLSRALREPGPTLVHVRVPPHGARDAQRAVLAALDRDVP